MSVEAKEVKQVVIDEIKAKFDKSVSVVAVDYLGITVAEADELRKNLREANVEFTVYKNTLVKRAIAGTPDEALSDVLKGSSAFAFCEEDATASARVIAKSIKKFNKMAFKGGIVEGQFFDADQIKDLSEIPSREELIARFMGSIQSPVSQLARTFKAIADAAPESEAPAEEAEKAPAEATEAVEA